jgi:uncharacterized membrane protein YfcA
MLVLLVVVSFLAGVGITAVGPGGIFVTVALFALTDIGSATVAGTALTTFVATGILGSYTYYRSGELQAESGKRLVVLVTVPSIVGAVVGALANAFISDAAFGSLLTVFTALVGVSIVYRERQTLESQLSVDPELPTGATVFAILGFAIGVLCGLLGIGGPVVTVPVLVVLGISMLDALAVAQVQSVFLSAFAAATYVAQGAISLPLVALVGIPELVGVVVGWHVAHRVEASRLKVALGATLVVSGILLAAT